MRLAWFTPLPPMASGISDYSSELLPLVAEAADVEAVCPRPNPLRGVRRPWGIRVRSPRSFFRAPERFDAAYYHLGNNPFHEFVYRAALRRPGICVFHDFVMHHLISAITIEGARNPSRYEPILTEEHGAVGTRLAELRLDAVFTDLEKFLFPLTGHIARRATGIVVHSLDSKDRMEELVPGTPVEVIPHHAGMPPREVRDVDRAEARRRLGLPADAFLVGHFGFVTTPKQPRAVLEGFARLRAERPDALLLIVGADRTGGGLEGTARALGIGDAVRPAGFVGLRDFYLYLKAVDAAVNLRYPSAGESSGTYARALAEGRVVIVSNYGSFAEVPPDVSLKVEIDGPQAEQVGEHLVSMARDPERQRAIEGAARTYARVHLDPIRCRDQYVAFARRVAAGG